MFGFKKTHDEIEVAFHEQGSTEPFATSIVPLSQLPDTFQIRTSLQIGGDEWLVCGAEPSSKEQFRTTGKVRLFLAKPNVQLVSPGDILFSLPTLSNDIAELEPAASLENLLVVHEDDWRQCELVCRHHAGQIEAELAQVRRIHETEGQGGAFRKCHVRSTIPLPLDGASLSLAALRGALRAEKAYAGVAFNHVAAVVKRGFAFRCAHGFDVWGQLGEGGDVAFACLPHLDTVLAAPEGRDAFDALLAQHDLVFVDWVHYAASSNLSALQRES